MYILAVLIHHNTGTKLLIIIQFPNERIVILLSYQMIIHKMIIVVRNPRMMTLIKSQILAPLNSTKNFLVGKIFSLLI